MGDHAIRAIVLGAAVLALAASTSDGGGGDTPVGQSCSEDEECVQGSLCFNQFCVGDGVLRFSLSWSVDSDFDLHVMTPRGSHIYWSSTSGDGGTLDVDQCVSSCGEGGHVENIVFPEMAPLGQYQAWVENFSGHSAGSFTLYFSGVGVNVPAASESLPATAGAMSATYLVDYN
jgi:hypothetical protein